MVKKEFTINDAYKLNVLNIVKHHKANCNDENCGVNLYLLKDMAQKLGIKFSERESFIFF